MLTSCNARATFKEREREGEKERDIQLKDGETFFSFFFVLVCDKKTLLS
jgi:hypothetical protein